VRPPRLAAEIFLIALAAILLEVSYTRVFSYKLVYFFTYVVIGLALLGLGSGGVLVSLVRPLRRIGTARLLALLALAGAVTVAFGYLVVATVQVNAFEMIRWAGTHDQRPAFREAGKLAAISAALFAPFLCAGIAIAAIFAAHPARINRLYFADLAGAALGCAASVPLMIGLSPPGCVVLAGACFALAGVRVALAEARPLVLPLAALAVVLGLGAVSAERVLPELVVDGTKSMNPLNRPPVLFSRWSPVFRVDVLDSPLVKDLGYVLAHDGMWGSILPRVDGSPKALARYDADPRAIPFAVLPPRPSVTIIGAAGGNEIVASTRWNAARVTAVELNPVTVSLLTTRFKEYTGAIADDPRVSLVNAEGRAFFDATTERSDLVWFVAPDSYAAMNAATSGAYVLSESYLYTVEMLESAFAHLEPGGVVCAQFGEINYADKPNRTTRYLTTAREALHRLGVDDFASHVLVATSPGFAFTTSTILLRREPFTARDVEQFVARVKETASEVRFAGGQVAPDHPVPAAITLSPDALRAWYATYPFDVRPITDDAPFFWHFVPFRGAMRATLRPGASATEEGLGERLLLVLFALVTVFAAVALLLPLLLRRALWRTIPHKTAAGIYFAALGLGFMFFEVTLIQRLTLFLGYPTYSLTVTLFALLLSTGIGSLASAAAVATPHRAVGAAGAVLVALVAFYLFGLAPLTAQLTTAPFPARVALATAVLFPLGLCLGLFMPLGLRSVAALTPHAEEYVTWAWAVNGFFSVVASVLATLLSMTFGFRAVMLLALAIYGVAILALRQIPVARAPGGR
jgi:spermidine synthase